ncbi:hypothetical protein CRG98_007579 [Punica granatum]|uniref:Uncharacterized protein n=1 Tax=Punica granatum TaxID=22663 RepID=A0A2I0KUL0_PUNGR|nr:hypothetical protein CRG98_007579 [Punica granatum]
MERLVALDVEELATTLGDVEAPSGPSCPIAGSQDSSILAPSAPVSQVETLPFTLGILGSIQSASRRSFSSGMGIPANQGPNWRPPTPFNPSPGHACARLNGMRLGSVHLPGDARRMHVKRSHHLLFTTQRSRAVKSPGSRGTRGVAKLQIDDFTLEVQIIFGKEITRCGPPRLVIDAYRSLGPSRVV